MRTAIKRLQLPATLAAPPRPRPRRSAGTRRFSAVSRCSQPDRFGTIEEAAQSLEGPPVVESVTVSVSPQWRFRAAATASVLALSSLRVCCTPGSARNHRPPASPQLRSCRSKPAGPIPSVILSTASAEALIGRLSELPGIKVVANSSSSRRKARIRIRERSREVWTWVPFWPAESSSEPSAHDQRRVDQGSRSDATLGRAVRSQRRGPDAGGGRHLARRRRDAAGAAEGGRILANDCVRSGQPQGL